MTTAGITLFLIGLFGLLGASFLPPALAALFSRRLRATSPGTPVSPPSLRVLIAAHNEEAAIAATLASVVKAAEAARYPDLRVIVGLDHCTDATGAAVREFTAKSGVNVDLQVKIGPPGKWQMLVELVEQAEACWVAFVDCGSIWEPKLLVDSLPYLCDETVHGIAPSYMPHQPGLLERGNWKLEQLIKQLESCAGGPISVHGATVFYRRATVATIFAQLGDRTWLNDDLVIPSMIRVSYPNYRLVYLRHSNAADAYVVDRGIQLAARSEYRRRRRLLHGSLEWLQLMISKRFFDHPVTSLLVMRRVFRMLWAYWISFLAVGGVFAISAGRLLSIRAVLAAIAVFLAGLASTNYGRRLLIAYFQGLRIPFFYRPESQMPPKGPKVEW